MLLYHRLNLR